MGTCNGYLKNLEKHWKNNKIRFGNQHPVWEPATGTSKTLEKHWKNNKILVPVNPGPRGPPTGPPRDPPRNPWEPCKTIGKTIGSRGICVIFLGWPPASPGGDQNRQRVPQKPLKSIGKTTIPWLANRARRRRASVVPCLDGHDLMKTIEKALENV